MPDVLKVNVRGPEPTDKDFIMASWLNGNRYGSSYFEMQDGPTYFDEHAKKITAVLINPATIIRVACSDEDIDFIMGFSVFTEGDLHWVYVRDGFRKTGIAKLLLNGMNIKKITGLTRLGASIAKAKGYVFEPL